MSGTRSMFATILASSCLLAAAALSVPASAHAQAQDKGQQKCISGMNKAAAKLARTQGKENAGCVKDAGKGKLAPGQNAQQCLTADNKGKVAKAVTKTDDAETKFCSAVTPDFGLTDAATVTQAVIGHGARLSNDVFGPLATGIPQPPNCKDILDPGDKADCLATLATVKLEAKCQSGVVKAYEKLAATRWKEFLRCKKAGLKDGSIVDETGVEDCLFGDSKGKIGKAVDKIEGTIVKKCAGLTFSEVIPGSCKSKSGSTAQADCIAALAECRVCRAVNAVDGVNTDCDLQDDGVANLSCPTCGNGVIEGDEVCDDGNAVNGDGCSATCQCEGLCGPGLPAGCSCPQCPDEGELTLYAGVGKECTTNADCEIGACDSGGTGRCVTDTRLDTGWTGLGQNTDINDQVITRGKLDCDGPGPTCGECDVAGVSPETSSCRCANDNRSVCNEPFRADFDDCGGNTCNCYFGPPLPLSAGNVPACVLNRFRQDITGTANVDTGQGVISASLASVVYLGDTIITPCAYCTGDTAFNDGQRDGTCVGGANAGQSCDAQAYNDTFPGRAAPATSGDGYSLDCFPPAGINVSGAGLRITLTQTTGTVSLGTDVLCGYPTGIPPGSMMNPNPQQCQCGLCSNDPTDGSACANNGDCATCTTNADCGGGSAFGDTKLCDGSGHCSCDRRADGDPSANQCAVNGVCDDLGTGDGFGECAMGPTDHYCDGIIRANGEGFLQCNSNADCDAGAIGLDGGVCGLAKTRPCWSGPISATGVEDANKPVAVAVFCVPPTGNGGINDATGLPGPGRVVNAAKATLFCTSDHGTIYEPGVGGCP
jgi:cysteine-rich repeat protein